MKAALTRRLAALEIIPSLTGAPLPWSEAVVMIHRGIIQVDGDGRLFAQTLNEGWEEKQRIARAWAKRLQSWRAGHAGAAIYPVTSDLAALGLELAAAGAMNLDPWAPVLAAMQGNLPRPSHIPQLWPGEKGEPYLTLACAMQMYDRMRSAHWSDRTPIDAGDLVTWLADALAFALQMEEAR